MCTHHFNKLKKLYDGRVEQIVSGAVVQQSVDDGLKQVPLDDVAVVVFILQPDDPTHEPQRACGDTLHHSWERLASNPKV